MKITGVEIFDVKASWRKAWNPVLVRVNTDEGLSGAGEAGTAVSGGPAACAGMVKDLAQTHLLGADPLDSGALRALSAAMVFPGTPGGFQ
ncbi:MAG: hypothetical protein IT514_15275 [Burkholderiales bacterium]|nr:hypothetical protein [Burkholderiales bacterium]